MRTSFRFVFSILPGALLLTRRQKYLEVMSNDYEVPMVSKLRQGTYALNTTAIIQVIRKKYVEAFVSEMLGIESLRVFRMLQEFKFMEEDQVR